MKGIITASVCAALLLASAAFAQSGPAPVVSGDTAPGNVQPSLDESTGNTSLQLAQADVIYCTKCGTANDASAAFCQKCGAPLRSQGSQPQVIIQREGRRGVSAWEVVGIIAGVGCGACLILYIIGLAASS